MAKFFQIILYIYESTHLRSSKNFTMNKHKKIHTETKYSEIIGRLTYGES